IYDADETLRRHHAEREAEAAFENLCKLYVAMTRARCANYLITDPRSSKSRSDNFVKLLETALISGDPLETNFGDTSASLLFETDLKTTRKDWFNDFQIPPPEEDPGLEVAPLSSNVARQRPRRRTPSGSEESVVTAAQIFSRGAVAARDFGTRVHEIFESIEWWSEDLGKDLLSGTTGDVDEDNALELVLSCLQKPEIQSALSPSSDLCEVWREKSFEVLLDREWLSGTFDRVTIERSSSGKAVSASILDFKTDRVESEEDIERSLRTYRPQMETYRRVLSVMLGVAENEISASLLFTRLLRLVEV
ncbi:MAG: PD-(D/E)XK nuclease family protein, partial [Verrucomicrobiota bacterium]